MFFIQFIMIIFSAGAVFCTGCKKEETAPKSGRKRECTDFALDVAAAYQKTFDLKDNQSGDYAADMKKRILELKNNLKKACTNGELSNEVITCVKKSDRRDFERIEECLPEDYRPIREDLEEE